MNFSSGKMVYRIASFFILFCCYSYSSLAQDRIPQFKDYPVTTIYQGGNAPLILTGDGRTFKTRLREAAKEKPNFAGHYIVTTWGCGADCQVGAMIDAKTGKVYWFPFPVGQNYETDENFKPVEFRLNSKLIIFSGYRVDKDEDAGARFYKFDNGRFVFLRFIKRAAED